MADTGALGRLSPVARLATAALIADQVRELVADGSFPQGSQLTEASLADALGVSRGPIREALQRLVQEGLLRTERNRGLFVPHLSSEDIVDIYLAREALETAAMDAVMKRDDSTFVEEGGRLLAEMAEAQERGDRAAMSSLDLRFHLLLIEESRSRRLARAYATLTVETRMCLAALERVNDAQDDSVDIHMRMLDAVRARDMVAAREAVRAHNETVLRDFRLAD